MKFNILIGKVILLFISITLTSCSRVEEEIILPTETILPTPTSPPTQTPIPSATSTSLPSPTPSQTPLPPAPQEAPVQVISLAGPIASPDAQISGMAWYGDTLVILPQYPEKNFAQSGAASVFALSKQDILDYLSGSYKGPLTPYRLSFQAPNFASQIPGYEGYEAIAFDGEQAFLTIEANHQGSMQGFLISGEIQPDLNQIRLDPASLTEIPLPVQIFNYAYETLLVAGDQVLTIYEANGTELNPNPSAFSIERASLTPNVVDFANIEYRLTDATALDENGRFWVMNIFMPIEFWLYTDSDPIFEEYGQGDTHTEYMNVERVLELIYDGES
ncbi:MAG: hypothetical protein IMY85_09565, partial [Chloroflexi bacterium]|nr:hypothetical protein [Chloroflexota bacterium]